MLADMSLLPAKPLPDEVDALQALVREQGAQLARLSKQERALVRLGAEREKLLGSLERENALLREQLNLALAKRYGASSEAVPDEQLRLFNEAEADGGSTEAPADDEPVEVAAHTRVRRGGRRALDPALPRVDIVHELAPSERRCPHDGTELRRIGEAVSEQLDIVPAKVRVLRHVRAKYACPCCERHVVSAPMPPQPIPKSQASPGLLAHIAVSKYLDGLPLNRQQRIFERLGVSSDRATLASWMVRCGALVQPLINLLRDELLAHRIMHGDETTVQVLNEPGKSAESKSYMWVQTSAARAPRHVVLFSYSPSRASAVARQLYDGFTGHLHVDGYAGYNAVCIANGVTPVGCWAHVRRKFEEVLKAAGINPKRGPPKGKSPPANTRKAARALTFMRQLFAIEHRLREQTTHERVRVRQAESAPVLDALREWLEQTRPAVPPKSALGKALAYLDEQWPRLLVYLDHGELEMTNNRAERAIRPFVIGRRAWLFSDSVNGAKASANLYSLIESARANGIEAYAYLRHIFEELPKATTLDQIEALLPYNVNPIALAQAVR